jgi:hypothetical protein
MDAPYYNGEPGAMPYDRPHPSGDGGTCKRYTPGGVETCQCPLCFREREKYLEAMQIAADLREDVA